MTLTEIGPRIWTRTHRFEMGTGHDDQRESFYLVRTEAFTLRPALSRAELEAEHVTDVRWWALQELEGTDEIFAPGTYRPCSAPSSTTARPGT